MNTSFRLGNSPQLNNVAQAHMPQTCRGWFNTLAFQPGSDPSRDQSLVPTRVRAGLGLAERRTT
jgi:hypothetical protein